MATHTSERLLILGGGLIGLSIAHELASKGRKVEILSRRRSEAAGFVAAGMLAPHAEGLSNQMLELGRSSLLQIPEWVQKIETNSGMNCGLRMSGIVVPFCNLETREKYPTARFGQSLNRLSLEKEIPGIASQWETGLLFSEDGQIDNRRRLMRALEKACVELGVHFQEGVEVQSLIYKENVFQGVYVCNASGQVEEIFANEAVLCSGAWSNQLFKEVPIFPVKGQMFSIQGPKDALKRIMFGPGIYLVPREDGLIIVGATNEKEEGFNEGCTPYGQNELQKGVESLLPSAMSWPHMERWWGFRPCTPDLKPILGNSSLNGLWLATGHHRNGVLLAAITSDLIGKCLCDQPLSNSEKSLLQQFHYTRFTNSEITTPLSTTDLKGSNR
ncbi:FAD-dependent oxidoreductase [Prochlorococcus marinus]|uniref:Putative thiamine biosynthesis oxidoreductase n=1 Tax=Prochlorococcus marinus (strain MIT 9211) TaxID=93059 RepID=A9B9E8_PROM4|nr:FAD-dependent oxidoreductase [Prochlorococcus marinus]ABX07985.1 putative thiamine biosynthesis oxidoreductase [Prochlorococcus marinus str. MIT 9211]